MLMQVEHLRVQYPIEDSDGNKTLFTAIHDVNFELEKGEILGIVGESGAGKIHCWFSYYGLSAKTRIYRSRVKSQHRGRVLAHL